MTVTYTFRCDGTIKHEPAFEAELGGKVRHLLGLLDSDDFESTLEVEE